MSKLSEGFSRFFGKLVAVVTVAALLCLMPLVWEKFSEAKGQLNTLLERREELSRELCAKLAPLEAKRKALAQTSQWRHFRKYWKLKGEILVLEIAANKAQKAYDSVEKEIAKHTSTAWGRIATVLRSSFLKWVLWLIVLFFLLPPLWKTVMYYGVARWLGRRAPIFSVSERLGAEGIDHSVSARELRVRLDPGTTLYVRDNAWCKQREGVSTNGQWLWSKCHPLISVAADMIDLLRLRARDAKEPGFVTLVPPNTECVLMRLSLKRNDWLVVRPAQIVAVTSTIRLRTRWNLDPAHLAFGKWRQILLRGAGDVYLVGGHELCVKQGTLGDYRLESGLLVACAPNARYGFVPTETFRGYLRGSEALFDQRLHEGFFIVQNKRLPSDLNGARTPVERFLDVLLAGLGKFFGF